MRIQLRPRLVLRWISTDIGAATCFFWKEAIYFPIALANLTPRQTGLYAPGAPGPARPSVTIPFAG